MTVNGHEGSFWCNRNGLDFPKVLHAQLCKLTIIQCTFQWGIL